MNETITQLIIITLIISLILIIFSTFSLKISGIIVLFVCLLFCVAICLIGIPFYFLRKKYATSMMVNELGIFTYNNKNELVETILYENILIIQLYDASGRDNPNPNLRIKVNNNGTAIWKTFPKLYYVGLTNKNELHLHFLLQAKSSQKKIEIDPTAIIYYQSLIKK
ncbi:hypothetical protein HXZ62_12120 [Empedobacter falsenii]|nr:hypothetical protein [Empedobacter falsenii]